MTGRRWIALILPLALLGGCLGLFPNDKQPDKRRDANQGDEMIVYSLAGGFPAREASDPNLAKKDNAPLSNDETFHGWRVLGKTTITSDIQRRRINDALELGIKKHDGSVAACFDPHHAIRFRHNGKTEDWVICFMCNQIYVFENERKIKTTLTSPTARPLLNDVLRAANVPLSNKAE